MPLPTADDVHVDSLLTNISVAYIQSATNFVAGRMFPTIPVAKRSDKYASYTKADWFTDQAEVREAGTESAGSGYRMSSVQYFCDTYAIHKDVDDDTRDNADAAIDVDRDATEFVTQRLMLRKEIQSVTELFSSSVWGTDKTPTNLWSSYTTSDPIGDIETGKTTILQNTGFEPNSFMMGYQVWEKVKHHPDIVDRFKYTSSESVTESMVGALLGLDQVLVAKAVKNTAAEQATASMSFTHGKNALLAYVNPSPGLLSPSAAYTFSWTGRTGGTSTEVTIRRFRMPELKSDRVEGESAFDYKAVATDLGYFFSGAVS